MSNWPELTIDELKAPTKNAIAMGPFGSRIKKENFVSEGIPVIKGGNLTGDFLTEESYDYLTEDKAEELLASNAYRGDIVITHRGTIGQVGIIPQNSKYERYVVSQSQLKVSLDKNRVNPFFVYYFLRSHEGQHRLLMNASQVGVPAIAQASTSVKSILVPCPDMSIQDKVVEILLNLDNKIQLNTQTNQTLEQIAQAIFKSWFVDFDPVRAKMAVLEEGGTHEAAERAAMRAVSAKDDAALEQMQREAPEAYAKLAQTAALFPSAMVESELGEIPEGWSISTIGEEVEIVGGGTPSTKVSEFWEDGEIHWTTPKDLSNLSDKVLLDTERKITEEGLKKISSGLLPENTVLMSSRAPVGYLALAKVPVAVNQGYIAMKCERRLSPEYVIQWANSVMDEIKQRASGTTFAEISKKNFRPISVLVPSEAVLEVYTSTIRGFYDSITKNVLESLTLSELRDSLLPRLLSGQMAVEE